MYIAPDDAIEAINDMKEESSEVMKINKKILKQTKVFDDIDGIDDHDELLSSYGY